MVKPKFPAYLHWMHRILIYYEWCGCHHKNIMEVRVVQLRDNGVECAREIRSFALQMKQFGNMPNGKQRNAMENFRDARLRLGDPKEPSHFMEQKQTTKLMTIIRVALDK